MSKFFIRMDGENDDTIINFFELLTKKGWMSPVEPALYVGIEDVLAPEMRAIIHALGQEFVEVPKTQLEKTVERIQEDVVDRETVLSWEKTEPVVERAEADRSTWPICPHCQEHFWAKRKDQTYCLKPECKKAKSVAYAKEYASKKNKSATAEIPEEAAGEVPFGSQEENGTA